MYFSLILLQRWGPWYDLAPFFFHCALAWTFVRNGGGEAVGSLIAFSAHSLV